MIDEAARGPPYGLLLAAVVVVVVAAPMMIGDAEAITESISELLSPVGLLMLPILLLLTIQFLSSERGSFLSGLFSAGGGGDSDSIHRVSGSPVGVALVLVMVLFLVYYRITLFGGGGGDDED